MTDLWKKYKGTVIGIITLFLTGGTVSVIKGPEYILNFFRAPIYYQEMDAVSHDYAHFKEMWFEWGRLITDNWDSTIVYRVADDAGVVYDVDVRWVNGPNESDYKIPVAFVGRPIYRPYPIYKAHADGRMYINVHDNKTGETQNLYLVRKINGK